MLRTKCGRPPRVLKERRLSLAEPRDSHLDSSIKSRPTAAILEAAVEVHRALGPGFLESVYENALVVAFNHRGVRFKQQHEVRVSFEGQDVGLHRLDLLVEDEIVVEIKAVKALEDIHFAQLKSYLKATGLHTGLLLNFNAPALVVKRVVL